MRILQVGLTLIGLVLGIQFTNGEIDMNLEREQIEEIVKEYIKENLKIQIKEKRDWYSGEKSLEVILRLGEDTISYSETF